VVSPGCGSVLLIEVPEAEPAVRRHRERLDENARLGIPAHITVLHPFLPADEISEAVLARLENVFAPVTAFRLRLDHIGWFGENVLWLGPRDPEPLRALSDRVWQAFPAYPPFEGRHEVLIPHLTVGHGHPVSDLRAAEESLRSGLPVESWVAAVTLMTEQSPGGQWARSASFDLGGRRAPRVRIVHLTALVFRALADGDLAAASALSPVPLSEYLVSAECRGTWRMRSDQAEQDPASAAWVTGVIWAEQEQVAVGRAGYHGPPDQSGMVEIGYAVDPAYRRRGYARAALEALLQRAARAPSVQTVRVSISPDNAASYALASQYGFAKVGEQWDDEDGLEFIYEVAAGVS
jgi:RimJ/RimL family protein N-acetyltransferase/2'-5' RNA ligase